MHKNSRKVSCFLKTTGIFRGAIFHAFLKMKAQDIFFCLYRRKLLCREYKSSYITDCRWYYPMWPMNDIFSECGWCWLAEDTRPVWLGTQMDACKDARTYPWGQRYVCRRTQEGSEAIQGIWWLLSGALCPVVLMVLLYHWNLCSGREYGLANSTVLWLIIKSKRLRRKP